MKQLEQKQVNKKRRDFMKLLCLWLSLLKRTQLPRSLRRLVSGPWTGQRRSRHIYRPSTFAGADHRHGLQSSSGRTRRPRAGVG